MGSEKKRNPGLGNMEEAYNLEYVSPYNYLLDYRGLDAFKGFDWNAD